jgi:long-chain fatty acid transport protein
MKLKKIVAMLAVAGIASPALATNGMNMEGYGPIATSMGGAAMAYDHGTAGVINNPATLGLMQSGTSRLDVALGVLQPFVKSEGQDSSAKAFYMPAVGYIRKDGMIAWGAGMMAQGGMGTKFSNSSMYSGLAGVNFTNGQPYAANDPGFENKSEIGVGRVIFPISASVTKDLNIGGSIDYVWAGMDIKWLIDGAHFGSMMMPGGSQFGVITGSMLSSFQGAMGQGMFTSMDYGYFKFDTSSTFSQKATSKGWAGNLGFTYNVSPQLAIGGVYHAKTRLDDMETDSSATGTFAVSGGQLGAQSVPIEVSGKVIIRNFQWPETYGLGMSFKASDQLQFVADYKRVNWANVMKSFNMSFIANSSQSNPMAQQLLASTNLEISYNQEWKNQNVFMVGASYNPGGALTYRAGVNYADNPVATKLTSPLFPAITKWHFMGGVGYAMSKASSVDFSLVYAPKVEVTNNWSAAGFSNQKISMSQLNVQAMYSQRF